MSSIPISAQPPRSWFRIITLALLTLVVITLAAGFFYENISEGRDRRFHPMPGELVDVGGRSMHIYCAGQGTPAVILDSGLGDSFASWFKVQPQIAKFTRVCSYDRAGLGYSDSNPLPPTSKNIAEELHTLLHTAGVAAPVVIVGHSMGGYDVRLYASLYRNDVAGMVLVDASHPDQDKRFPQALHDMEGSFQREAEFLEFAMPFGLPRLLGFCGKDPFVRAAECTFQHARESVAELKTFPESAAQAATSGSLGDMPLAVLSHDPDKPQPDLPADLAKPVNEAWGQMQEELAHLSTRGTRTIAKNSLHYIQIDRPDVVIDAIHKIVEETRQPRPQTPAPQATH